jgi:uncharacterized protein YeaC (DUF1315 family)
VNKNLNTWDVKSRSDLKARSGREGQKLGSERKELCVQDLLLADELHRETTPRQRVDIGPALVVGHIDHL